MTPEDIGNAFSTILADHARNVASIGQRKADKKLIKHIGLLRDNINGSASAPDVTTDDDGDSA